MSFCAAMPHSRPLSWSSLGIPNGRSTCPWRRESSPQAVPTRLCRKCTTCGTAATAAGATVATRVSPQRSTRALRNTRTIDLRALGRRTRATGALGARGPPRRGRSRRVGGLLCYLVSNFQRRMGTASGFFLLGVRRCTITSSRLVRAIGRGGAGTRGRDGIFGKTTRSTQTHLCLRQRSTASEMAGLAKS